MTHNAVKSEMIMENTKYLEPLRMHNKNSSHNSCRTAIDIESTFHRQANTYPIVIAYTLN